MRVLAAVFAGLVHGDDERYVVIRSRTRSPAHTPSMEIAELQHLEAAMREALAELYARASAGELSADLVELAQHVRELLLELLDEGLAEIAPEPTVDTLREFARAITVRLAAVERELAGERLQ